MPNRTESDMGTAFEINRTKLDLKYFAISVKMEKAEFPKQRRRY